LLLCIEELTGFAPGSVLYIGDHEVDAACAFHTNQALQQKAFDIHVKSIGAFYGCDHDDADWTMKPDYRARVVQDILSIVQDIESRS
jgi:phosphoglycolate phosphatase-like HAD superfamily hydrolase